MDGDVAQLVECWTSAPLKKVQFPSVARDSSPVPESIFSADSLTVSVHLCVQLHILTPVRMSKIL